MLKLLGRSSSINVQKVMWFTAELGLEIDRVDVGGKFGGNDTPEYLAKNPNGLIPTLEDGDCVVWESNTIVRYLAENYGQAPWFPVDAQGRAVANQWMEEAFDQAVEKATECWILLDKHLGESDYLTGADPTMGDIPAGCSVNRWYTMDVKRPPLTNLEAWHERLKARPAYQEHVMVPLV
jgi:glutathione S-transferase